MKLWILRPVKEWSPWYDHAFGFVVRAENADQARELASDQCGDEGERVWLDPAATTCAELEAEGPSGVMLRDFAAV